jgi:hypothetical protein
VEVIAEFLAFRASGGADVAFALSRSLMIGRIRIPKLRGP